MSDLHGQSLTVDSRESSDSTVKAMAQTSLFLFFPLKLRPRYMHVDTNALCKEYRYSESVNRCHFCLS